MSEDAVEIAHIRRLPDEEAEDAEARALSALDSDAWLARMTEAD